MIKKDSKTVREEKKSWPLIIAAETSGRMGSVALALGGQILSKKRFSGPMRHSAEILPCVLELLEQYNKRPGDIEHVYVSVGPGSFTGLRIAVTIAKMLNLVNNVQIVTVSTLDVIAAGAKDYIRKEKMNVNRIAVVLDAKRGQFFAALYEAENGVWRKVAEDSLMSAEEVLEGFSGGFEGVWLVGEGLVYYKDKFAVKGVDFLPENLWEPRASNVAKLGWEKALQGEFSDAVSLKPAYLRESL